MRPTIRCTIKTFNIVETKLKRQNVKFAEIHTVSLLMIPFSIQVLKKSISSLQFSNTYCTFKQSYVNAEVELQEQSNK